MIPRTTDDDARPLAEVSPGVGEGVLAVRVAGRVRRSDRFVIGIDGVGSVRFVSPGVSAVVLGGGWHGVGMPQSRVGVNVGAVWIEPGMCTEVTVIANWFTGPQHGRFARTATLLAEW